MIGSGMGLTQISAGMYTNGNQLNLEKFPVTGLHKAYAGNSLISDAAAGATAFACGVKTYNGAIGVDMDSLPVKSMFQYAEERQLSTGLVSTASITHATTASFVAHVKSSQHNEEIAESFLDMEVDFFVGGGKKYFDQRQKDKRDLVQKLKQKGYVVSHYLEMPIHDIPIDFDRNFAYFTADTEPESYYRGRNYLEKVCQLAPLFLKRHGDNGFVLVVESAQIEWGGHANDPDYIVSETLEFDRAIGKVLEFAERDGQTLVLVTADHETGGFSINQNSRMDSLVTSFTTDGRTGVLLPVFAYGPGAEAFSGVYENTAVFDKMLTALGISLDERRRR